MTVLSNDQVEDAISAIIDHRNRAKAAARQGAHSSGYTKANLIIQGLRDAGVEVTVTNSGIRWKRIK